MPMTLNEARQIGAEKLKITRPLFDRSLEAAKHMGVRAQDLGPMTLALALMGIVKANRSDRGIQAELTDALAVVSKAETEWSMEHKFGKLS